VDKHRQKIEATFGPEDLLDYIYAIFHSPTYRSRYAEFLRLIFRACRSPQTSNYFTSYARSVPNWLICT
jgi:predicted helicase